MVAACYKCNSLKGDMPLLKFLQVMTGDFRTCTRCSTIRQSSYDPDAQNVRR